MNCNYYINVKREEKMKKITSILLVAVMVTLMVVGCGTQGEDVATGDSVENTTADNGTTDAGSADASDETSEVQADINEDGTVNNPESVEVKEGSLVFWSLFSGGDGGFMDEMIDAYNSEGPDMEAQPIMLVWADYYTKLQTAVAAGKGPDIGVSHVSKLPELVEQGAVVPIDSYLEDIGVSMSDLYTDGSIDSVTFSGDTYGIPLDTHAEIMYYNRDILDEAGVELNSEGKLEINSADDFISILDKIKLVIPDGSSALALTNSGDDPYRVWWATYFQMNGTAILSEDGTEVTLDKEVAMEAAKFVKSLYEEGYILEGIDDHQAFFQSGKAGILFGGTWATGAFEKTEGLNFGAQNFPKLFETDACWADAHIMIIPFAKDRTEQETLESVKFIVSAASDGGVTWAKSGQIPSNVQVVNSDEYAALDYRSDYKNALNTAVLPPQSSSFYAMKAGMIDTLNAYWTGQNDVETAINNLYSELESNIF